MRRARHRPPSEAPAGLSGSLDVTDPMLVSYFRDVLGPHMMSEAPPGHVDHAIDQQLQWSGVSCGQLRVVMDPRGGVWRWLLLNLRGSAVADTSWGVGAAPPGLTRLTLRDTDGPAVEEIRVRLGRPGPRDPDFKGPLLGT